MSQVKEQYVNLKELVEGVTSEQQKEKCIQVDNKQVYEAVNNKVRDKLGFVQKPVKEIGKPISTSAKKPVRGLSKHENHSSINLLNHKKISKEEDLEEKVEENLLFTTASSYLAHVMNRRISGGTVFVFPAKNSKVLV